METLRDRIRDAKASKAESMEAVFFALKGVNTRVAIQNLHIYRDI
jgi:hypothetical protein